MKCPFCEVLENAVISMAKDVAFCAGFPEGDWRRFLTPEAAVVMQRAKRKEGMMELLDWNNLPCFPTYFDMKKLFKGVACPECDHELVLSEAQPLVAVHPPYALCHCEECGFHGECRTG